jgi:CYTH domain-containing protein
MELEVDVFDHFDDFVIGEIEFRDHSQLETYDPPHWFGEEITREEAYRNAVIATHTPVSGDEVSDE